MSGVQKEARTDSVAGSSTMIEPPMMVEGEGYFNSEQPAPAWTTSACSQLCRMCATENEYLIPIFDGEGVEHQLGMKIDKHLPIRVHVGDTLPLHVCYQCASTLIAWHDLVVGCIEAEKKLLQIQSHGRAEGQVEEVDVKSSDTSLFYAEQMDSEQSHDPNAVPGTSAASARLPPKKTVPKANPKLKMVIVKTPSLAAASSRIITPKTEAIPDTTERRNLENSNAHLATMSSHVVTIAAGCKQTEPEFVYALGVKQEVPDEEPDPLACGDDDEVSSDACVALVQSDPLAIKKDRACQTEPPGAPIVPSIALTFDHSGPRQTYRRRVKTEPAAAPSDDEPCAFVPWGKSMPAGLPPIALHFDRSSVRCAYKAKARPPPTPEIDGAVAAAATPPDIDVNPTVPASTADIDVDPTGGRSLTEAAKPTVPAVAVSLKKGTVLREHDVRQVFLGCFVHKNYTCSSLCSPVGMAETDVPRYAARARADHVADTRRLVRCTRCRRVFSHVHYALRHIELQHPEAGVTCHVLPGIAALKKVAPARRGFAYVKSLREYRPPSVFQRCMADKQLYVVPRAHYDCAHCARQFAGKMALTAHLRSCGGGGGGGIKGGGGGRPSFLCDVCGAAFARARALAAHRRGHVAPRDGATCDACGKTFAGLKGLKAHLPVHVDARPHTCLACGKTFGWPSALKAHERTHVGERPFECVGCGKAFGRASHLRTHMRIHTGLKPYACGSCDERFMYYKQRKQHRVKAHSVVKQPTDAPNVDNATLKLAAS